MFDRDRSILFLAGFGLCCAAPTVAQVAEIPASNPAYTERVPTLFFENQGQMDREVKWASARGGVATFHRSDSFAIRFSQPVELPAGESAFRGAALEYTFLGASPETAIRGEDPRSARFNFLIGTNPENWRVGLPSFATIRYESLYEGIDVTFREMSNVLEYDLILAPGADLESVRIHCAGADSLRIDEDGSLVAATSWGDITQRAPRSWQTGKDGVTRSIDSHFVLLDSNTYGFRAEKGDSAAATVIDPGITYSTYLGGARGDHGCGAAVDEKCGVFVTGDTLSVDYPTTIGSFDVSANGNVDVFVTRLNSNLSELVYSTFVGGKGGDYGHGVAVPGYSGHSPFLHGAGVAHVSGGTLSTDFPVSPNAIDPTANGKSDAFMFGLSSDGSELLYSTYVGGSGDDGAIGGQSIALDPAGGIYITGYTGSADFPTTALALDTSHNGMADMFVCRFTPDGTALVYSSLSGGSGMDVGVVIDVDSSGIAYVGSTSTSINYPTTPGAYSTGIVGSSNGVVTKLNADGSTALYSSFTGGADDSVRGISARNGECYVAGYCLSSNFPTTPGAAQPLASTNGDGFVLRLSASGGTAIYATLLGGSMSDGINDVDTDENGQAYVSGWTDSSDFPVTAAVAYDPNYSGYRDTFCTRLSADGKSFDYSTYLGGSGYDVTYAIEAHDVATLYVVGGTSSTDFPTTPGAFDSTFNGVMDVFVTLLPCAPTTCTSLASTTTYGVGEPNSAGLVAALTSSNLPTVPSPGLNFSLTQATPNAAVFFLVGGQPANTTFDSGTVLVTPTWIFAFGPTDGLGTLTLDLPIVDNPNFCGDQIYLQAAVFDPNLLTTYQIALSNGLLVTFGN